MNESHNINTATIERIAELARLALSAEQKEALTDQLKNIITSIDAINTLDLDNVEPLEHIMDLPDLFREDTIKPSLLLEETLKNAPKKNETFFKVPKVLE